MDAIESLVLSQFAEIEKDIESEILAEADALAEGEEVDEDTIWEITEDSLLAGIDFMEEKLLKVIPELIASQTPWESIPGYISSHNADLLEEFLDKNSERFPRLSEYIVGLDHYHIGWQPLLTAIRTYFSDKTENQILTTYEHDLAIRAFTGLLELPADVIRGGYFNQFAPIVETLINHTATTEKSKESLQQIISIAAAQAADLPTYRATEFTTSTGGLEPQIVEWIQSYISSEYLFEDDDFDFELDESEEGLNLEALKANWLSHHIYSPTSFNNYVWVPIEANADLDYMDGDKQILVTIHLLSQIMQDPSRPALQGQPPQMDYFKISLIRTGEHHEYDFAMDQALLALQVLIFIESSNTPLEKVEAEISWLRLNETSYPLLGLTLEEIEAAAHRFIDAQ
jgi:hypothetical protein